MHRLLADLTAIDWPEETKRMQENWIGRSEGTEIVFRSAKGHPLPVFTTRPDTVFGVTFMAMAPEHELAKRPRSCRGCSVLGAGGQAHGRVLKRGG